MINLVAFWLDVTKFRLEKLARLLTYFENSPINVFDQFEFLFKNCNPIVAMWTLLQAVNIFHNVLNYLVIRTKNCI